MRRGNARAHRFTVFDVMEAQGVFDANPANSTSPDFKGPVQYPKMFYHPKGDTRVTQRAEVISTPLGPQRVGEMKELIHRVANDADEEHALREAGWWDHPALAIKASGGDAPPMVSRDRETELQAQIDLLMNQLAATKLATRAPLPKEDEADKI
jgi:hypothetical protein